MKSRDGVHVAVAKEISLTSQSLDARPQPWAHRPWLGLYTLASDPAVYTVHVSALQDVITYIDGAPHRLIRTVTWR